jgi:hypothetical protein
MKLVTKYQIYAINICWEKWDEEWAYMGTKTLPTIWHTYMKLVTKYQISVINICWEKCDEKCAYMFNVYKSQLSRQTGSRNLTGQKTVPTKWGTFMKLVTKCQISAIIICWEKWAYMFNVHNNQQSRQTGNRNLMGPKTLPTIWGTDMKPVTKYQICVINSCWENCDEKCAYMFNVYKNQLSRQRGSRNLTGPKTLPTIWGTDMKLVTKYQICVINSCWENCDEKCAYMFNVYKNQLSRQTGSRNLTDQKTVTTKWGTYMKLVTKYQISAINICWEKCDEKWAYMFNVHKNQQSANRK